MESFLRITEKAQGQIKMLSALESNNEKKEKDNVLDFSGIAVPIDLKSGIYDF